MVDILKTHGRKSTGPGVVVEGVFSATFPVVLSFAGGCGFLLPCQATRAVLLIKLKIKGKK
jgi:hypothetical protein